MNRRSWVAFALMLVASVFALSNEAKAQSEIQKLTETLSKLQLSKAKQDGPKRAEAFRTLEPLVTKDLTQKDLEALAALDAVGGETRDTLRRLMVRHASLSQFDRFATLIGLKNAERRNYFLAKEIKISYRNAPLRDVFSELWAAVSLPLWIDAEALSETTPMSIDANGAWLEVMDQVLAKSDFRLAVFHNKLYWLGRGTKEAEARAFWERSVGRIALLDDPLRTRMQEPTTLKFSDIELRDVVDYWQDLHGVRFWFIDGAAFARKRITATQRGIPFHLAFDLIAEKEKLDWTPLGGVVVCGTPAAIETVRLRERELARRRIEWAVHKRVAGERLLAPTTLEFIRTPLFDVCAYLSEFHEFPIAVASGDSSSQEMNANLKGVELANALELLLFAPKLSWDMDGEAVFLGTKDELEEFGKLEAARNRRRMAYPEKTDKLLRKRISISFADVPLSKAAPSLARVIEMPVELGSDDELAKTPIRVTLSGAPADVALDLICLMHGLTWDTVGKGEGVLIKRAMKK